MELELRDLLRLATKNLTVDQEGQIEKEDGSFDFSLIRGNLEYNHNVFQGEAGFGGREVVYYDDEPVWITTFFARHGREFNLVSQEFLRKILQDCLDNVPLRGPEVRTVRSLVYTNSYTGDIGKFDGIEKIYRNGKGIYEARYMGGYII